MWSAVVTLVTPRCLGGYKGYMLGRPALRPIRASKMIIAALRSRVSKYTR
jgi:hypothetical protein